MHLLKTKKGFSVCIIVLCTVVFMTVFGFSSSTPLVHAVSPSPTPSALSPADLALLGSLRSQQDVSIHLPPGQKSARITLDNEAKVQAALKRTDLSPLVRSYIGQTLTQVEGQVEIKSSPNHPTSALNAQASTCVSGDIVTFIIQGLNNLGENIWSYMVTQGYSFDGQQICDYGRRVVRISVDYTPTALAPLPISTWSVGNEGGSLGYCCPTVSGTLSEESDAVLTQLGPSFSAGGGVFGASSNSTLDTEQAAIVFDMHGDNSPPGFSGCVYHSSPIDVTGTPGTCQPN